MTATTEQEQLMEHLKSIHACQGAREWAKGKTAKEAWETCERAD